MDLFDANLKGAILRDADLREATLTAADLSGARMAGANLKGVDLSLAQLNRYRTTKGVEQSASLEGANLDGANLTGAQLERTSLLRTQLAGTKFFGTRLEGAVFEPATLPDIESISHAIDLRWITYDQRPSALLRLRKSFKEAGYHDQQKEITHALMRTKRLDAGYFQSSASYLLFELTSEWGLSPLRPLWLLLILIIPFACTYAWVVHTSQSSTALWQVWDKDRIRQDVGQAAPVRLGSGSNVLANAVYFSVMSAFSVGWQEIRIGTWLGRLNPNEYTLQATGWLRSVSGLQSLISIFLLALAFLCYFGDPFGGDSR